MKISVIGAGNVGGLTAMRLAQEGLGDIFLVDISKGLAQGKCFDMEDAQSLLKKDYSVTGTENINDIKDSGIIIITAGLARKPGMTREDLLNKNASILKDICSNIKSLAPEAIVIIVTNPLDLLTCFALKNTGFAPNKILGMGLSLDSARFANLISKELNVSVLDIDACVIASHGEGMLPLPRYTKVKGVALDKLLDQQKRQALVTKTIDRGKEIVSLLGSGSAYFAPSAAVAEIVKIIVKDQKSILGVSVYLKGEYGINDICIGVPCCLGRNGIEKIIELDLNEQEKNDLQACAEKLKEQYNNLVTHI
ncbi:MAG: malate dehydrogenase [Candidatus Omnitrophota bacterium]